MASPDDSWKTVFVQQASQQDDLSFQHAKAIAGFTAPPDGALDSVSKLIRHPETDPLTANSAWMRAL
eukprot:2041793-Rhodomonas_salina.1